MNHAKHLRAPLALAILLLPIAACDCGSVDVPLEHRVDSFTVAIEEVSPTNPPSQTGDDPDHALPIPLETVKFRVTVTAIDENGQPMPTFDRPVSFRVKPGNLVDVLNVDGKSTGDRMLPTVGGVATGWVVVEKVFGDTKVWAQDSPPAPVFSLPVDSEGNSVVDAGVADAGSGSDAGFVETDGGREFASGSSRSVFFVKPTIADIQRVPVVGGKVDNRGSPFVSNFLTIDAARPRGDMIVTAITAEGFYVTDLLAKRLDTPNYKNTISTFGHIYVYNYSYPDNLAVGDRVLSLTGTVQEFSGDTQLVFPSWVRLEGDPRPEDLPEPVVFDFSDDDEMNPSLGFRLCKINTKYAPKFPSMEQLCAYSNNNIEIESIESGIVKVINAKPSTVFPNCDANGNSNIPPFRWMVQDGPDGPDFNNAKWGCDENGEDTADCVCNMQCISSQGDYTDKVCSEWNTYRGYGQWLVQLEDRWKTRINVSTRDALPDFDPREFGKPEHAGCTVDITGVLRQVQAARPRFLVLARTESDICCRAPEGGKCPAKIPECPKGQQ